MKKNASVANSLRFTCFMTVPPDNASTCQTAPVLHDRSEVPSQPAGMKDQAERPSVVSALCRLRRGR